MSNPIHDFTSIGLVGLGLVGSALIYRLQRAEFKIIGFDINPEACKQASVSGVRIAASLQEIAEHCPRIVLSLPDANVVEQVLLDPDGLLAHATHPLTVIDTTTGDPSLVRTIAERVSQRGSDYCDACLIGSSALIHEGDCVVVTGVPDESISPIHDILHAVTHTLFYMGKPGSGSDTKLVVNHVIGLHRLVLAESLLLAESLGLDLQIVLHVLKSGVSYSRVMDTKGEKMITADYEPQARLQQHLKDVRLINALGDAFHSPLPLSRLHESILQHGMDMGLGECDNAAVIEILKKMEKQHVQERRTS